MKLRVCHAVLQRDYETLHRLENVDMKDYLTLKLKMLTAPCCGSKTIKNASSMKELFNSKSKRGNPV